MRIWRASKTSFYAGDLYIVEVYIVMRQSVMDAHQKRNTGIEKSEEKRRIISVPRWFIALSLFAHSLP